MNSDELTFTHRFIPAENVAGAPTLLLLHGTGGSENDLIALASSLGYTANLLSPRGRVLENGNARFFKRLREGVFDEDDLKLQTHALASFVADAANCYGFDASNVIALGFSNGANIAASLLLLVPQTLSGAILLRAQVPFETQDKVDLSGKKVLLASGEYDPLVPVENARLLTVMLRERGAHVAHEWQDAGHNLTNDDVVAMREWLSQN